MERRILNERTAPSMTWRTLLLHFGPHQLAMWASQATTRRRAGRGDSQSSALPLVIFFFLAISAHLALAFAPSFGTVVGTTVPSFTTGLSTTSSSSSSSRFPALLAAAVGYSAPAALAPPPVRPAPSISSSSSLPVTFVAETKLPTLLGDFHLRAYRVGSTSYSPSSSFSPVIRYEPVVLYKLPPQFSSLSPSPSLSPTSSIIGGGGGGRVFGDLVSSSFGPNGVPVRVHDQCFTSEVFGSLRCDCKSQLLQSLKSIQVTGGAVIYLQQEGRGIGLANKIRAYSLQDAGMDTVDANLHLGFGEDERSYDCVPAILSDFGIDFVQLLTNNPCKVNALRELGVKVRSIDQCVGEGGANIHNKKYLETKVEKMGHGDAVRKQLLGLKMKDSPTTVVAAAAATATGAAHGLSSEGVVAASDGYCFGKQSVVDCIAAIVRRARRRRRRHKPRERRGLYPVREPRDEAVHRGDDQVHERRALLCRGRGQARRPQAPRDGREE